MKLLILLPAILYLSYFGQREVKPVNFKGIWIPKKVNWKNGNFDTYCFLDDSSVVIISSDQKRIKDSIIFKTEPGFIIKKGTIKSISDERFSISYKIIYRFIKLKGGEDNKIFEEIVTTQPGENKQIVIINEIRYQRAFQYTNASKESIFKIVTKMVPEMEKHPEQFN
jgi:hypothetical protein